jgi:23S rRNA (guanosine2251-2'-O)-methyltransferase
MMKKQFRQPKSEIKAVYGVHPVMEALQSGVEIEKVFIQQNIHGEWLSGLRKMLNEKEIPVQILPAEGLNRLFRGNHQGIAAFVSPVQYQQIEGVLPMIYESGESPLLLVLDRITDVRNLGAIARTAEAAGVHAIILPARGSAQINADAIKTSSGALLKLPLVRSMNLKNTLVYLRDSGVKLIAATEKSNQPAWKFSFAEPLALLLGSEENGVSPEYLKLCHGSAMIPMHGQLASLNVSVAAGMFLYEVIRQRNTE